MNFIRIKFNYYIFWGCLLAASLSATGWLSRRADRRKKDDDETKEKQNKQFLIDKLTDLLAEENVFDSSEKLINWANRAIAYLYFDKQHESFVYNLSKEVKLYQSIRERLPISKKMKQEVSLAIIELKRDIGID